MTHGFMEAEHPKLIAAAIELARRSSDWDFLWPEAIRLRLEHRVGQLGITTETRDVLLGVLADVISAIGAYEWRTRRLSAGTVDDRLIGAEIIHVAVDTTTTWRRIALTSLRLMLAGQAGAIGRRTDTRALLLTLGATALNALTAHERLIGDGAPGLPRSAADVPPPDPVQPNVEPRERHVPYVND